MDVGGWRLDRECVMSLPGYSLHFKLKLPSSGVIIDFDLTGIWTFAELTTGQARQASCQNPGEAWTRKVSLALQGLPGPDFTCRSCCMQMHMSLFFCRRALAICDLRIM